LFPFDDLELTFSYLEVVAVSIIAYSGSMVGIILMSVWYTACWMNITFIGTTLVLMYLMLLISWKSKVIIDQILRIGKGVKYFFYYEYSCEFVTRSLN